MSNLQCRVQPTLSSVGYDDVAHVTTELWREGFAALTQIDVKAIRASSNGGVS